MGPMGSYIGWSNIYKKHYRYMGQPIRRVLLSASYLLHGIDWAYYDGMIDYSMFDRRRSEILSRAQEKADLKGLDFDVWGYFGQCRP